MRRALVFCVDMGGTDIKVGLITLSGMVIGWCKLPSHASKAPADRPSFVGPEATIAQICLAFEIVLAQAKASVEEIAAIGLCTPGPATGDGLIGESPNLPLFASFNLRQALQESFGRPTSYLNDGWAGLLGELHTRGLLEKSDVSAIALFGGTGIGGGVYHHGRLIVSADGCAAHLGHLQISTRLIDPDIPVRICGCGLRDCLEAHASLTAWQTIIPDLLADTSIETSLRNEPPENRAYALRDHALQRDAFSLQLLARTFRLFGLGFGSAVKTTSAKLLIIGGGMAEEKYAPLHSTLLAAARYGYDRSAMPAQRDAQIAMAVGGDCAYLGAGLHAVREFDLLDAPFV